MKINKIEKEIINESVTELTEETLDEAGRGRPRKNPAPTQSSTSGDGMTIEQSIELADKQLDDPEVISNEGQIESVLNELLEINEEEIETGGHNFQNVLFVGSAGTGKTSRIEAWAKAHNINLVKVLASVMDDTDLGGAISQDAEDPGTVKRLATKEFDELGDTPRSVLFLDEYNRAPHTVRGTLLTLIQDHTIRDDRVPGKQRFLPNFLFTIAAVNPYDPDYDTYELDDAEKSRFRREDVYHDNLNTLNYLTKELDRKIAASKNDKFKARYAGQKALADAILRSKDFKFDTPEDTAASKENGNGLITSARTFTNALFSCDGTKDNFLNNWNKYCNSNKLSIIKRILADYKDVNDKANDALKGHDSESNIFADAPESNWDKIAAKLADM